jgi:preprotein translocase subunit SecG
MWLAIVYAVLVTVFSIRYIVMVVLTRKDVDTQREIAEEERKNTSG